jgi:alanine dehydrogenase
MEKAARFAEYCRARLSARVIVAGTAREAVERADIICTVTSSPSPVLEGQWLKPGQHLNLVGSSTRASREVDDEAVARGLFVVDSRPHALSQAGELRHAIEQGHVDEKHVAAEIGEVLAGKAPGRSSAAMITTYKSLGHVAQDIRLIDTVYNRLGQSAHVVYVPW